MAVLICLALSMGLMPIVTFASSYPGQGTESSPFLVSSWDGSKTASCTVTVAEAPVQHKIVVLESPGGRVSTNVTTAEKDDTIIVSAVPDTGYDYDDRFDVVVMDSGGNRIPCLGNLFMMPESDVTVKVNFSRMDDATDGNPFTDVNDGDYFKDAVLWAVENGVTSGTGKTTFSPDGVCTRAQAVTFLWRANGSPMVTGSSPFVDVKSDDYYQQAVQWAVQQGITKGTSETTFSPEEYCSRAHIVTFLHRATGSPTASGALFSDVSAADYFADAVRWAVSKGITQGTTATTFSPNADCTRAQIVTFIYRQMN